MYLSPSLIKTFESCKLRYKWQYIDKIYKPQPLTDDTLFGRYVHRFMELYERKKIVDIIKQLKAEFKIPDRMENDLVTAISNTVKFLKQYGDLKFENEQKISATIGNLRLSGKTDKIYLKPHSLIVIDFKTSRRFWKGMNDLQLKFYSLVLHKERKIPAENIETVVYYSYLNAADANVYNTEEINYFLEYLKETASSIYNTQNWVPTKSKLCNYCQYKEDCPAWK